MKKSLQILVVFLLSGIIATSCSTPTEPTVNEIPVIVESEIGVTIISFGMFEKGSNVPMIYYRLRVSEDSFMNGEEYINMMNNSVNPEGNGLYEIREMEEISSETEWVCMSEFEDGSLEIGLGEEFDDFTKLMVESACNEE